MLNLKVIGAGAAGNKAAISLIKAGFNKNDVTLINSTVKDIPDEYKDNSIIFGQNSNSLGGCGKERDKGKELILQDMKNGKITLDNIADPDTNAVIIVSSTEGGSGSAATPVISKYIKDVLGIPVIVILFFGFNTDVRGMQNSIEICQELQDNYGVIGISNAKFFDIANKNTIKAEQLANSQFVKIVKILSGKDIIPGTQNIDDTDLFKLIVTPGYMMVETASINKIKNTDQYNNAIMKSIDESTLIDCSDKGSKRIGIIYDVNSSMYDCIDLSASVIKEFYGTPYELFTHVQTSTDQNTVTWIATGLPLPIKEIEEIYKAYQESSNSVNKNKDTFFDNVFEMKGNQEDEMFNMLSRKEEKKMSKASFFADFGMGAESSNKTTVKTSNKKATNEY